MIKVSEKIKTYRLLRNYTQQYMADCLGLSRHAYINIETARADVPAQRLIQIAEILEIKPHLLLLPPAGSIL